MIFSEAAAGDLGVSQTIHAQPSYVQYISALQTQQHLSANDVKAIASLPAGPNNPVGVVWIDINVPHYGLHGTPEPSRIGVTESHGCVRLTNWDAAHLAALVKVGTPVLFR